MWSDEPGIMHGVKRDQVVERDDQQVALEQRRIQEYKQLIKDLSLAATPDQVLILSQQVLLLNPESYQTWNIRKRALLTRGVEGLGEELDFNVQTIKLNPKSYCAWFHRKWLLEVLLPENGVVLFDWKLELRLCGKLLALDSRNCTKYALFSHLL